MFDLRLPRDAGHEPHGKRYGVVVQSDALLPRSVVLIAPTSTSAESASFRPEIEIDGDQTKVLVEQIGAVDVSRLGDIAGHLSSEKQWGVDTAILTVLGLN
ncbi:MAG: type II toxin-antitoxin system PemK/MazF family toxin [Acidimicrobiia bacterium]